MDKQLSKKIVSGMGWKFGERIIAQGISFIISIVLARLLSPKEYGTIALVLVFITIANVFVSDGLGAGLIQKKSGDLEFSTMFYCSLTFGVILYFLLFLFAPLIASFYSNKDLIIVVRVLALQLPLASIKTIQHAYISKYMMFKKFFFSTLAGTIISGVIGIIMAYCGMGVWALVEQYLVNSLIDMIVLFFTVNWRPKLLFSIDAAKKIFSYSWKLLAASLINTIYNECRNLIIGKKYSESDLAFNTKGSQFPSLFITNIDTAISSVLFPAMASVHEDKENLKILTKKSMKMTSFLIFPLMIGLMTISESLVVVLLTDKWLGCVPFLIIACIYWMFQPCLTANNEVLKATGRTDICLKIEIIKKIIGFLLVILTMNISVFALAMSNALFALLSTAINIFATQSVIHYGYREQIADMLPSFILSSIMGIIVYFIGEFRISKIFVMILQILCGGIFYLACAYILKMDSILDLIKILKKAKN